VCCCSTDSEDALSLCIAVCGSVLLCDAVCCTSGDLQDACLIFVCHIVLQCVAACCSVLQRVAIVNTQRMPYLCMIRCVAACFGVLQFVAVCCGSEDPEDFIF